MFKLLWPCKCFRLLVCACMYHYVMIIFPFLKKFLFFLEAIIVLFVWVSECFSLILPTLYLSCRNFLSVYSDTLGILLFGLFEKPLVDLFWLASPLSSWIFFPIILRTRVLIYLLGSFVSWIPYLSFYLFIYSLVLVVHLL